MKKMKKCLSFILAIVLLASSVPLNGFVGLEWPDLQLPEWNLPEIDFGNIFVTTAKAATSGTCGENLTWVLDDDGSLTISGVGEMTHYSPSTAAAWYSNRSSIKKVIIEDGVTSIGDFSFRNCTSLTSVTIPHSVTNIGTYAFFGCNLLESATIPSSVNSLENAAFGLCSSLKSVAIPDSVTSIGEETFEGCISLTSVKFPDSLTSIGKHAFSGCTALTSITIPDRETIIGDYAFCDCTSLNSITIPDSVKSVGYYAFNNTAYYNDESNWESGVLYIGDHLIEAKKEQSVSYSYTIKEGTKTIAKSAFDYCNNMTSITIPDTVTIIGAGAFAYCTSLTSITIPANVTNIGSSAFICCLKLKSVIFEENSQLTSISAHMFEDSALTSIIIPDGVTQIEDQAFWDCAYLTSVTIPDTVKSIGNTAFRYCIALTSIEIPASVEIIGNSAFHLCSSLTEIKVVDGNENYTSENGILFNKNKTELICYPGGKQDTDYNIPRGVENIRENAFYQNINIVTISVPDSVTSIGDAAFYGCDSLTSINIPAKVTEFNKSVLNACPSLVEIIVDQDNTAYCSEDGVLYNRGKKTLLYYPQGKKDNTFSIPSTVTAIDEHAFNACPNLKYVYIPDNVTEIGIYAFYNCSSLQSVHFYAGSKVTEIKQWTFFGCSSLKNIIIPTSIKSINYQAFLACNKLESVCFLGTKSEGKKIAINSTGNAYLEDATWYYCEDITDTYVNGLVGIQNYEYTYNDSYFFTNATKYNHNLAIMSFCLALSAMLDKETDDNGDEVSLYENQNNYCGEDCCTNDCKVCPEAAKDLFAQLSFQCLQYYGYCKAPTTDSIACVIANKKIGDTTIVAIGIRGKGYETEWAGNFTLGTEETHVGFTVAKDKVLKYLSDYIKNNSITGNVKFWISGFSRAAATANLVAATLDDGATGYAEVNKLIYSQNDVYAYTFETPRNTRNPKAKNECYKNIFNILNCIDAVPKVAPAEWKYVRYGNDLYLPSAETKTNYSIYTESLTEIYDRFFTEDNFFLEVLVKGARFSKNGDLVNIVCGNESLGGIWDRLIHDLVNSIKTVEYYAKNYQNKIRNFIIELSMDDITTDHGISNGINTILEILPIIEFEYIRQVLSDFDVVKKMHDPLFNFAWVAAVDENALTTEENGSYTAVKFNCPIDVQLYNADGELLAEMVGDEVTIAEDCYMSIFIDADGQKCFYLPKDGQYSFVITGNGEGTMSCSFSTYDFTIGETTEVVNYYDLPVQPGQEYYVSVDKKLFDGSEADESLANKVEMTNQEDEVIDADEVLTDEDTIELTVTIENESENSYAIGGGTYYKGEYVVLTAIAAENETFLGWYIDGELISSEESYRFRPEADCTVVAKWEVSENGDFILGDLNGDGQITSADARTALRAAVELDELTATQQKAADADKNGEITSADARLILRASVGLEEL